MKRILFALAACAFFSFSLFAQSDERRFSAVQVTFLYPLGTNGARAYRYTNGASLNMLVGLSRNENAFALGGLANIVLNDARGVQIAGLYNHVGNDGKGFALSGLAGYTGGHHYGVQLSGLANIARDVSGLQFAGLVNIAKNVRGVQFAGLINIADNSDYPIGVINIIRNGEQSISATYNEVGSLTVSYRSGGRVTYGVVGAGYSLKAGQATYLLEGGFGAHLNVTGKFRFNNEVKIETLHSSSDYATFKAGYSLLPGYKLTPHVEILAGPNLNYMYSDDPGNADMFPSHSLWKKHSASSRQQVFVGYQIGVQYIF